VKRARVVLVPVAVILGGFLAFVMVADLLTASPRLCGGCHAMAPATETWRESAHAAVRCVACHESPRPWYETPQRLAERTTQLSRDVYRHVAASRGPSAQTVSTAAGPPPFHEGHETSPMGDEVCLQCHDPNRKATSGFRIRIEHAEHARRNGSCVSCHYDTAHPEPQRGRALSLMSRCFTCHGRAEQPEASAACEVCHPADFDLRPESHEVPAWKRDHGLTGAADKAQCRMCHTEQFCTDCHGVQMPHPEGWARGRSGHAAIAEKNREVCSRCHTEQPDLCSMCHHKAYDPSKGTWVKQHFLEVRREGTVYCMKCHSPLFCVDCHAP
jgi:hypothetical protein